MVATMARTPVGELLRTWRTYRHRSQLDLALDVGVSPRHLSFVETGRSRPSAELLLALADGLDVPLRERNTLLLAAGYAPRYSETALDDPAIAPAVDAVRRLLDAHDPLPGIAVDRMWDIVLANTAAQSMLAGIPERVASPVPNLYRIALHPDGLAAVTVNFEQWGPSLVHQLRRSVARTNDPALESLLDEVRSYPNVAAVLGERPPDATELLVPLVLDVGGTRLAYFTVIATFGTPRDVTLDELAVELFYPAGDR
jgi:transcriptional regulator with XRE-family HTH domain